VEWTFATEELAGYSPEIREVENEPCIYIHGADAARKGLVTGDHVALTTAGGRVEVKLCVVGNMAEGLALLPRHRQLGWQKLGRPPVTIPVQQIRKLEDGHRPPGGELG
jgi:anaerobic selenocysteine-containing dehydrogenase